MAIAHVLIADDSPSIRFLLSRTFDLSGFIVSEASNARDVLSIATRRASPDVLPVDVIVAEYTLPDLHGLDLVAKLRAAGIQAPVLLTAATVPDDSSESTISPAGVEWIEKPFSPIGLVERVRQRLTVPALSA